MPTLKVTGTVNMDGDYEIVYPPYVQREWHEIKMKTGLVLGDLEDAFNRADADAFVSVAWVTLTRNGFDAKQAWAQLGEIDPYTALVFGFEEGEAEADGDDAVPPEQTRTDGDETETPSPESATESSSASSRPSLVPVDDILPATGTQG